MKMFLWQKLLSYKYLKINQYNKHTQKTRDFRFLDEFDGVKD